MGWTQDYDPLGNPTFSTLFAALPLIVLLGAIGVLQMRAHLAALLGLLVALCVAVSVFGMPIRLALASVGFGAAYGLLPIGWIILNLIFPVPVNGEEGDICRSPSASGFSGTGSTHSVDSDRFLVRSVFRGSRRIRNAGGNHGGHSDAARVLAAASVRSLVDCQYGTGRLRSAWDTGCSSRRCDGSSVAVTVGDGGQTTPLFLVDHSVLGRLGVCRIPRRSGCLAGGFRGRGDIRDDSVPCFELPRSLAGRHCRRDLLDGRRRCCCCVSGSLKTRNSELPCRKSGQRNSSLFNERPSPKLGHRGCC